MRAQTASYLFPLLCYSLPSLVDGSIWGLTRSKSILHSLENQRRVQIAAPAWSGPLSIQLTWLHSSEEDPRHTPPGKRVVCVLQLSGKDLWADGIPTNGTRYLRYTRRAALLFCMRLYMAVHVPVWDVCTHVMCEPVRGQLWVLWPQELPPYVLRQCHFLEPGIPRLAWLARESQGSACLCLPGNGIPNVYGTQLFLLRLVGQACYQWVSFFSFLFMYFPHKSYTPSRVWRGRLLR